MGDPRRLRKKYKTPLHPWQASRIKEEIALLREYGLSNKKEIWKIENYLRSWQTRARKIIGLPPEKQEEETKILMSTISKLGILKEDAHLDDILALQLRDVLDKRLQTIIYKMGLAATIKQSRQFIVHNKAMVNGKRINSPSFLVNKGDKVEFVPGFKPVILTKKPQEVEAPKNAIEEAEQQAEASKIQASNKKSKTPAKKTKEVKKVKTNG